MILEVEIFRQVHLLEWFIFYILKSTLNINKKCLLYALVLLTNHGSCKCKEYVVNYNYFN